MPFTICIANEKGGVAKTTTAISLGASLAEKAKQVLLVDLDSQANLTLAAGVPIPRDQPTIAANLLEGLPLQQTSQATAFDHLSIIPSNHEITKLEKLLPIQEGYTTLLHRLVNAVPQSTDFVVLDCPPVIGALTLNAITAADLLVIPTQAEYFSINALRSMMRWIRQVRLTDNPKLLYRLLITMFDRRNRIHRALTEQIKATFGTGLLNTMIEIDTRLRESTLAGIPITRNAPNSRAASQYRDLANEIISIREAERGE
ncbi:MAG TPA: ParA family protein [Anaerolineaceae bacterium]